MSAEARAVRCAWALAMPGEQPALRDVTIAVEGGQIGGVETGAGSTWAAELDPGRKVLAMPALVDAHDHGRGIRTLAYGAVDDAVEVWLPALYGYPRVDPYLNSVAAFARLARGGVAGAVHCHQPQQDAAMAAEASEVTRAARDVGIRLACVIPLRDRNRLAYAPDEHVLAHMPPEDREAIREHWLRPLPAPEAQVERVEAIAAGCDGDLVQVQYGPLAPQWCSDRLLELIAEGSNRSGRRVHMHLLESQWQREWADAAYPDGLVRHLDVVGLLSPRLTVAHGVWLRRDECELLAERGVTVSVNTSSNLRLRSGVAPLRLFLEAGLSIGLGLDGLALDDDDDMLRELRLAFLLHARGGVDGPVSPSALFRAATRVGARAVSGRDTCGRIEPGLDADLLFLDYEALAADVLPGLMDESLLVLGRASARFIRHLMVSGRWVLRDGQLTGIDERAVLEELRRQAESSVATLQHRQPLLQRYQARLRDFYHRGLHRGGG